MGHLERHEAFKEQMHRAVDEPHGVAIAFGDESSQNLSMNGCEVQHAAAGGEHLAAEVVRGLKRGFVRSRVSAAQEFFVAIVETERGVNNHRLHFFAVTTLPSPGCDSIWNSSISRRTPGRPRPRL